MHGLEGHAALLDIGRDRVDDGVGPGDGGGDRGLVAHVGAEDCDPIQARRAQGAPRPVGMPDRDAHSRSLGGEALHEPPAEEPRAAEHADRGHGIPSGMLDQVDPAATNDSAGMQPMSHAAQLGAHDLDRGARVPRFPKCLAGAPTDGRQVVRRYGNMPIHT